MALTTSLYQHYTSDGINSGLSENGPVFTLNDKSLTIFSGAMHYFRVPREYWRDRLRKMKAAGLNTVETYIPWNLHEPQPGWYDFGDGGSDMEDFLNIKQFLKVVQEEDLFALVRPGPYICAEWEFGGFPSWLLREKDIKLRTSDEKYMGHVKRYFKVLLQILAYFQFTQSGPIIGFQVENEYGSTEAKNFVPDQEYLKQLKQLFIDYGIRELLFTSDNPLAHGSVGSLPELFQTANFKYDPEDYFDKLKTLQGNKPSMAMELWSGWFDHWGEPHNTDNLTWFEDTLSRILQYPASLNFYMFHGGTSWGFLNGANIPAEGNVQYQPDISSYDYNAPLTEAGDYTPKYFIVKNLLEKYSDPNIQKTPLPTLPNRTAYPSVPPQECLRWNDIIEQLPHRIPTEVPIPMELLPINNNTGQSYGYVIYRKNLDIPANSTLTIKGYLHDSALILLNGELMQEPLSKIEDLMGFGYWNVKDGNITLPESANATLDIVVLNNGRNNFGPLSTFRQFKGLQDKVLLNGIDLLDWIIMPMEWKRSWSESLTNWRPMEECKSNVALYKFEISLNASDIKDSFIDMSLWNSGIVLVNGFVLGRYMIVGPQRSLYLPAPLLKEGVNKIVVFEHFGPGIELKFTTNSKR